MLDVAKCGDRLVAVGNRGLILASLDGGKSWAQSPSPIDVTLTSLVCLDDRHGFAVGHEETLLRTDDGGSTWKLVQTDAQGTALLRVRFIGPKTGFAVGALGTLLRTVDGGATWVRSTINTSDGFDPHLFDVAMITDGRLIVAAEAGRLLRSSDGGSNWTELTSPYNGSFFGLAVLSNDQIIAYGMLGHAFLSTDGGDSWADVSLEHGPSFFSSVTTASQIFLCGADGAIAAAFVAHPSIFSISSVAGRPNISGGVSTSDGLIIASNRGLTHVSLPTQ
jgi:photosystem II stability/assembly factor-like uncharacterized protein